MPTRRTQFSGVAGLTAPHQDRRVLPSDRAAPTGGPRRRISGLSRRYDLMWLGSGGTIEETCRVAPATPAFEDAFAALGRGALIATDRGPVAVEDLLPGMVLETADGPQTLLWIGATLCFPSAAEAPEKARLVRIAADAFGHDKPQPDLLLGPRARLLYRNARVRQMLGTAEAFAPARAFVDGVSVVQVAPVSPVRVFHLGLYGQHAIYANGVAVESYHPGEQAEAMMSDEMLEAFLELFPHATGLADFGPMPVPRLTAFELESLRAA